MTDQDLDLCYSSLCEAMARVGAERAPLFLSMLSLSLLARSAGSAEVLPLIAQAERRADASAGA